MSKPTAEAIERFATELRKWWSFDDCQQHTHSWHTREDFIAKQLPQLLAAPQPTHWQPLPAPPPSAEKEGE